MDARQLSNMLLFLIGLLLIWAAVRMFYVMGRPMIQKVSPQVAEGADFVLL